MKLSISNIAWDVKNDEAVYTIMKKYGFSGLEIAPTKWYTDQPYGKLELAKKNARQLMVEKGLDVVSMQSICYGKTDNLFNGDLEFQNLLDYCVKALDFAVAVECPNLVFGCPKNRNLPDNYDLAVAKKFFLTLGDAAKLRNRIVSVEPNPVIYGTNFLNTTLEAWTFIKELDHPNIKLNCDLGTMIYNQEPIDQVINMLPEIGHVHLSEPKLIPLEHYPEISMLLRSLKAQGYQGAVSIEMGQTDLGIVEKTLKMVREVFDEQD